MKKIFSKVQSRKRCGPLRGIDLQGNGDLFSWGSHFFQLIRGSTGLGREAVVKEVIFLQAVECYRKALQCLSTGHKQMRNNILWEFSSTYLTFGMYLQRYPPRSPSGLAKVNWILWSSLCYILLVKVDWILLSSMLFTLLVKVHRILWSSVCFILVSEGKLNPLVFDILNILNPCWPCTPPPIPILSYF